MFSSLRFLIMVFGFIPPGAYASSNGVSENTEAPAVVEIIVSMENSLRPRVKGKLPQVSVRMDLSQYPGAFDGNLTQAKRLSIDYITAYVNAYQKAYVQDRSLLSNTYPFSSSLDTLVSFMAARGSLDNLVMDKEIFNGKKPNDALKSRMDEVAEVYEVSGELAFTREWLSRLGLLGKDIQEQRDLLERVRGEAEGSLGVMRDRHSQLKRDILERLSQVKRARELGLIFSLSGLGLSLILLLWATVVRSR